MTATRVPTPQGISRLLASAGFERAQLHGPGLHRGEVAVAGYHVHKMAGEAIVNYWPVSVPPTARTTAYAEQERRTEKAMLEQYARAISEAGWGVELSAMRNLHVFAAKPAAP